MKAIGTWFLASASLALGLLVACLANRNQVRGELGARLVRSNADLERDVREAQLAIEAQRGELERRVLAGELLPYEQASGQQAAAGFAGSRDSVDGPSIEALP